MPVEKEELEEILKNLMKEMGTGVRVPISDQPSSSQPSQQPISTSPSGSADPKEKEWEEFFTRNNITDQVKQTKWKGINGLTIDEAQKILDNGWEDIAINITDWNDGNRQISHSSSDEKTDNIDLLRHKRQDINTVHKMMHDINKAELPSDILIDEAIETYDEKSVPENRSHKELKKMRDGKAKELFKKGFGADISDDKIDAWRNNDTGLRKNGTDERKASDNGWTEPDKISNGKLKEDNSIDVLKHNKDELVKVNDIIEEIRATATFKEIDDWKTANKNRVEALVDGKLPTSKQKKGIWDILTNHRNTFKYYLNVKDNEVKNDGLDKDTLTLAREKLKEENRWKSKEYKPLTAAILNELLAGFFDKNAKKENLDGVLRELGGYTIDKEGKQRIMIAEVEEADGREEFTGKRVEEDIDGAEVIKREKKWSDEERLDLTGTLLLPYVYSLINYNPDATGDNIYAKLDETGEIDKSGSGVLPILTGGGKTTKTIGCLVRGKKNNVVLVCPNEALAADAEVHHKTWLQRDKKGNPYKCVIHGEYHGGYNVVKDDLIYYEDRTDPNNIQKVGEYGLSILQAEKLLGFIARSAVKPEKLKEPVGKKLEDLKKTGQLNENFAESVAEMKKKVISKEDTIVVFDEAHFNDPKYQELQKRLVKMNYKVIIMSATFPKKKFSITMSHPRDVWLVPQFEPEYLEDGKTEKWSVQKTQIFLRTTEDEFKINPATGKKGTQLLWSGLTDKQKKLLDDNNIAYVCFDRTNQGAVTGITQGMPNGSLFFANPNHEMGFSPHIHNVICTGRSQLVSLGKSGTPWIYDTPEETSLFLASMVQQIGRVARLFKGDAYLLTKDLYDIDAKTGKLKTLQPAKDLSYKFVTAALSGAKEDLELLKGQGANMGDDPNFLRAALALPYKFGLKPEEILVGTGGTKPLYPIFKVRPTPPVVDEELWNRHLGNPTPPKIDKERSEQILLLIVMTFLKNQADITKKIDISFDNSLIKDIWGKEVPKKGGKKAEKEVIIEEKAAEEVRKVLCTFVDKCRVELKGYKEDKDEYSADEKDTYNMLVGLYRVVNGAEIKVEMAEDKGKMKPTIKIAYPVNEQTSKKRIEAWEEIDVWRCHRCLKVNNGYKFCEQCGIDVRLDKKAKDKEKLMEELQARIEVSKK